MIHLLGTRRFAPLFWVQALGAFNDNVLKQGLVMLVTFRTAKEAGWNPDVIIPMLSAIFLLPYALFGSLAGQMCDRYDKTIVTRWVKFAEIFIMLLATLGFLANLPVLLMFVLFLMGTHSTFFGPIKYGILPQHLQKNELMGGAGLVEASTFLAILSGTIWGGQMLIEVSGVYEVRWLLPATLLGVAVAGWLVSLTMPCAAASDATLHVDVNLWRGTQTILREAKRQTRVWRTIQGLSWFWTLGAIWMSILPVYVEKTLHGGPMLVTIFLTMFSVGIGLGSLATSALNHEEVSAKYVPLAGLGLSALTVVFVVLQRWVDPAHFEIRSPVGIAIAACLVALAFCGGLFSTPLYAGMQAWSDPEHRSRNVASNNVVNAFWTVGGMVAVSVLASAGLGMIGRLLLIAGINVVVSFYILTLVPESSLSRWVPDFLKRL
jgi:acyl-[acyl-carrier-protein]-phospholipid O-acyltransferase/long-chain-fatty-acid--[acyl-carrier-protein] ligase